MVLIDAHNDDVVTFALLGQHIHSYIQDGEWVGGPEGLSTGRFAVFTSFIYSYNHCTCCFIHTFHFSVNSPFIIPLCPFLSVFFFSSKLSHSLCICRYHPLQI